MRSQLFNRDEEPTFDEAVTKVMQEESRLQALKGVIEGNAYIVKSKPNFGQYQASYPKKNDQERINKEEIVCHYCKRVGHIKDKCWQLHPELKPPHFAKAHMMRSQQGEVSKAGTEGIPSTLDFQKMMQEIQNLKSMINTSGTVIGSTSMANSGKDELLTNLSMLTNDLTSAWILDSGATDHMTPLTDVFESYEKLTPGKHVQTADGTLLPVVGIGKMSISHIGKIDNVLHVPKLFVSLISVQRLAKLKEYSILFDDIDAYLCHKVDGWKIGLAKVRQGLYYLPGRNPIALLGAGTPVAMKGMTFKETIVEIHQRMGHPSFHLLKHMYPHLFKDLKVDDFICDACQLGKFKRTTYPSSNNRTLKPFQLIHCDVWGPSPTTDILGNRYFLVCTDDCSRFSWLFLLKTKSEVARCIKNLCALIKRQFGKSVKGFRTDNAKDFLNNDLSEFFASEGLKHETSCPYTPQQNGLAERKIGDVVDKGRTLLIQANVPINLWGFAIMTAAHLINRLPSQTLDFQSPIGVLTSFFPGVSLKTGLPFKTFGCTAYVYNPMHKKNKWSTKALKCIFLGYSNTQKGYKVYHPITRKYMVSKDVIFDEKNFFYLPTGSGNLRDIPLIMTSEDNTAQAHESEAIASKQIFDTTDFHILESNEESGREENVQEEITDQEPSNAIIPYPKYYTRRRKEQPVDMEVMTEELNEWPIAIRKEKRSCVKPLPHNIANYLNYMKVSPQYQTFLSQLQDISIPKNSQEALRNIQWKEAMDEEMRALLQNNTWEIVDLPPRKKPVGCRWVYTLKCKSDGSLDRYKARLVARGYTQTYGIDYQETFAPVAKMNTIRILISLAVNLDWPLNQYDIKNAFLHGDLKEEVYMEFPPGYEGITTKGKVCKLRKALYGLKQSPRAWFGRFSQALKTLGYHQCNGEHTLFFKGAQQGLITILIVYVDDIIITGNNLKEIKSLEDHLDKNFEVKQLGPLRYFLGIEFARSNEGILMTQQKYILDLLDETKHTNCHINETPIEVNHKLTILEDDPKVEIGSYQKLIGKLLYLSHTRPDICYSVNILSQFMHSPRNSHFQAANRILRYLKGTSGLGITYRKTGKLDLILYTDSDFAGSRMDYRSTTGYCTIFGGNLVTWRSKKQSVVSKSSTEAEFRAMSKGIDEVMWIKHLMEELQVSYTKPITIRCDNRSAISIAHDPVYHDRMKHVNIDRFYIQEHLEQGVLKTEHVASEEQCADIFTKGLPTKTMRHLISKLGMRSIHSSA